MDQKEYHRNYRAKNKDAINAYKREWNRKNGYQNQKDYAKKKLAFYKKCAEIASQVFEKMKNGEVKN